VIRRSRDGEESSEKENETATAAAAAGTTPKRVCEIINFKFIFQFTTIYFMALFEYAGKLFYFIYFFYFCIVKIRSHNFNQKFILYLFIFYLIFCMGYKILILNFFSFTFISR
jgi:hypothetical protein